MTFLAFTMRHNGKKYLLCGSTIYSYRISPQQKEKVEFTYKIKHQTTNNNITCMAYTKERKQMSATNTHHVDK